MATTTTDDKTPYTQILYLSVPAEIDLCDASTEAGRTWSKALDIVEQQPGFIRLSWGRSPEDRTKVQLHTVRTTLAQHQNFLYSASYGAFQRLIRPILLSPTTPSDNSSKPPPIITRHAPLTHFTPSRPSPLSPTTPITGTAIYISTTETWHAGAWPLWTHIVRHVPGALGIAGGSVLEPVVDTEGGGGQQQQFANCYIVYVGWESIAAHEAYHHTQHFAKRRVVLGLGNEGYREYMQVRFEGERVGKEKQWQAKL